MVEVCGIRKWFIVFLRRTEGVSHLLSTVVQHRENLRHEMYRVSRKLLRFSCERRGPKAIKIKPRGKIWTAPNYKQIKRLQKQTISSNNSDKNRTQPPFRTFTSTNIFFSNLPIDEAIIEWEISTHQSLIPRRPSSNISTRLLHVRFPDRTPFSHFQQRKRAELKSPFSE